MAHRRAQKDPNVFHSAVYPVGSEFALCHAQSQLMSAVVGVLNESLTESIKGFYKLRKAYITLDGILEAEVKYMRGMSRTSLNPSVRRSVDSLRSAGSVRSMKGMPGGFGEINHSIAKERTPSVRSLDDGTRNNIADSSAKITAPIGKEVDEEGDEFYDAEEDTEAAAHLEMNGNNGKFANVSLDGSSSMKSPTQNHRNLNHDPDSDIFANPVDVFIHSGANLCFGLLLLMISMIPPAFSKLLFIIGFRGDRDRGLRLLWQASKFHNINGAMAGLVLLGYYNTIVGFSDILPDSTPASDGEDQPVEGYPKQRCELLLADMRIRHPQSHLWLLEEARMQATNRRLLSAIKTLNNATKSPLKQVEALEMFERSLVAMYMHDYALCSTSFLACVKLNNWSHALYFYIAGAAHVMLYRQHKTSDSKLAATHAEKATEYLRTAPKHAGKKKFLARQLPFDLFVTRKINKWDARAKEWKIPFIDAVGVSPIEEMIFLWNGYKRMDESQLQASLDALAWSDSPSLSNQTWKREGADEHAILAVLQAATLRSMQRWDEAISILQANIIAVDKAELKGGFKDDWTAPAGHYEMAVICWMRRRDASAAGKEGAAGKTEEEYVRECETWVEKAARWEGYELDARIGLKVATAQDTLRKWRERKGRNCI